MAQLALRWILLHEGVTATIPGAKTPEQARAQRRGRGPRAAAARDDGPRRRALRGADQAARPPALVGGPTDDRHRHVPGSRRRPHRARAHRPARPRPPRRRRRSPCSPARSRHPDGLDRPYLVFLQGGPGFEATRPTSPPSGWMKRALADYRVLLLDQRGTGRSTPVGPRHPGRARRRTRPPTSTHFRADSIVRDCELIRAELGVDRWSLLGQSFGGFTSLTYLSIAPEGLAEALITGGLSPIGRPVDDIYGATYVRRARGEPALLRPLPGRPGARPRDPPAARGARTSGSRRATGSPPAGSASWACGWATAPASSSSTTCSSCPFGSPAFLHDVEEAVRWARNPIYATLHESSYADGVADPLVGRTACCPTRSRSERGASPPSTSSRGCGRTTAGCARTARPRELLAEHPWPRLYDADRLRRNEVPVAATIYVDDVYVERAFAEETAAAVRGPAAVDHERVRAQRAARRRRAGARPADRHGARAAPDPAVSRPARPTAPAQPDSVSGRSRRPGARLVAGRVRGARRACVVAARRRRSPTATPRTGT